MLKVVDGTLLVAEWIHAPTRTLWAIGMVLATFGAAWYIDRPVAAQEPMVAESKIREAVMRSLPLLELASAGSARQRSCFTCHSQAHPVLAMAEAKQRGIHISRENFETQIAHTHAHLKRGLNSYREGKGQGGGVDTAGYALWTLEVGSQPPDETTNAVVAWLMKSQQPEGYWKRSSLRPPSEASNFTTTYLALRALEAFGQEQDSDAISQAKQSAARWLASAKAEETEDQVFQLLAWSYVDPIGDLSTTLATQLQKQQREDGGWAQLAEMESDAYATSTVLYALRAAGALATTDAEWTRGIAFLLDRQEEDGSWWIPSRSNPFQPYYETGFPHREDQFISTTTTAWATVALLQSLPETELPSIEILAGTKPLDWPEVDLSSRMMQAAHSFVETQIAKASQNRKSISNDLAEAPGQRQQLRTILGVVDQRSDPRMEHFGDASNPSVVFETETYQVLQVRWPVFANINGEGLLVRQLGESVGGAVIIPDADQMPEEVFGFVQHENETPEALSTFARQLAESGFTLVIPSIVSRSKLQTKDERLLKADYTSREWIYRQAFHMGRHVIGYDVQRILSAVDYLNSLQGDDLKIGLAGYGEGGLLAFYATAIDERIDATLVSGFFDSSSSAWDEPIYRNVWSRLKYFGNAEIARLIAPRKLLIEHAPFPTVVGHKGALQSPAFQEVEEEFQSIREHESFALLFSGEKGACTGPFSASATGAFSEAIGCAVLEPLSDRAIADSRQDAAQWMAEREQRTTSQLEEHVQTLVRDSEDTREAYFLHQALPESLDTRWSTERRHPELQPEKFTEVMKTYRESFHKDAMGRFDEPLLAPNARTRKIAQTDQWTAYDVVVDVHEGLFSWGVLVIPNNIQPNERRPVVVCQHGRNGLPRDTLDTGSTAYNDFAAKLAEQGFITFSPHNLYRGEDRYRWLDRKANSIGCTLFSFIIPQHDATLRWLDTLPFVDGDRIAFYGLSYGGETAMRVPTVLEKYCLSICSGDFNQWTRKVAATDQPFSFMNTIEWEMPYWNLGNTFDYAEMAYLMFPRPFMVERGHHDRVGQDPWVAYEFAKVRWLYAQFGMADRLDIEFFQGGHSINGERSFEFLQQLLNTK
jgi:dienelactone hydrolase